MESVDTTAALQEAAAPVPAFSDTALLIASPLVRRISRVVFVLMVARELGPERFGVYALLFATTEILAVASGAGYADFLTREAARDAEVGWGMAFQLMLLRIGIAIPVAATEIAILAALHYPRLVLIGAAWMALTVGPRSVSEAVQGVLRGIRRYNEYFFVDIITSLTLLVGGCLLLVVRGQLAAIITVEIAAATLAALIAILISLRSRRTERFRMAWRELIRKTFVFQLYPFVTNLYDRVDVVLLSKLGGDYATGIYSVAYRGLGTLQLIPYGVLYGLLPSLSRSEWSDVERKRLERAMGLLLSVAFVVVLATLLLANAVVHLLLGARYMDSAHVLKYLIWATVPMYLNFALNVGLLAMGRERVFLLTSSICLAVNFVGNLVLIPRFSWRAAAVLTVVTELVLLAQNVYWIRRAIGRIPVPWGGARTSLAFAVLMAAALAGSRFVSMSLAGTASLFLFVLYLHRAGMLPEFARVWRSRRAVVKSNCPS